MVGYLEYLLDSWIMSGGYLPSDYKLHWFGSNWSFFPHLYSNLIALRTCSLPTSSFWESHWCFLDIQNQGLHVLCLAHILCFYPHCLQDSVNCNSKGPVIGPQLCWVETSFQSVCFCYYHSTLAGRGGCAHLHLTLLFHVWNKLFS